MKQLTLVLDNIRSAYNVGSILRSAAAFGAGELVCIGITPYTKQPDDSRLPHVAERAHHQIIKTALGGEKHVRVSHVETFEQFAGSYHYPLLALEQDPSATPITEFKPQLPCAIIIGNEVDGIGAEALEKADSIIEIPHGQGKESLNAASAAAIGLYHFSVNARTGG